MTSFTMLTRENIFRDTKTWYNRPEGVGASQDLLEFCRQHAGKNILDLGCATGDYCLALNKAGFSCVGADTNELYVKRALERGIDAVKVTDQLPFADKAFDTVIMFEVLEHAADPEKIILEAKRVAARRILITVPDCSAFELLRKYRLVYNHFLDLDHISFFTKNELSALLSRHFKKFSVEEREPLICLAGIPLLLRKMISLLYRLRLIRPQIYFRLYAVIEAD